LDPNQTLKEENCIPNATLFVRDTYESSDDDEEEESIE
jgi:hypothetical protein